MIIDPTTAAAISQALKPQPIAPFHTHWYDNVRRLFGRWTHSPLDPKVAQDLFDAITEYEQYARRFQILSA